MRIWMINHYAIPPTQAGGTRHFTLAKELIQRGHDVTIIASSFDHVTREETRLLKGQLWKREVINGVPFLWVCTPPYSGNGGARIVNMLIFAFRVLLGKGVSGMGKPDVVIGSSPHLFAALVSKWLARRYKIPFVLEVRDLWPQSLIDLGNKSPNNPVVWGLALIEKYLYRRSNKIISLLPGASDHIALKGGKQEDVVWLPNGVDISVVPFPTPPEENQIFTVMYAGTHGYANGLDSILDTAAIMQKEGLGDHVLFRLVGDGPEKSRLIQRAKEEGIKIVRFENPVQKSQVYKILQEANVYIVTLRNIKLYRFGISLNKIYDYLAMARPIIFGSSALNNPVNESLSGITVPPEDSRSMAKAIIEVLNMPPAQRWEMGLRGRHYVEEHHDFSKLADQLENILYEVTVPKNSFSVTKSHSY